MALKINLCICNCLNINRIGLFFLLLVLEEGIKKMAFYSVISLFREDSVEKPSF